MTDTKSTGTQNQQSDKARTEADRKATTSSGGAPHADHSSNDHKSHTKAGSNEGAGGGAKQQHKN